MKTLVVHSRVNYNNNAETWTMTEEMGRKLLVFEMAVLRCIAGISRWDRRRNVDMRKDPGISRDVVNHIRSRRLVLWACGPYVTKPHPEHHAIRKSAWEETSGQTKEVLAR